METRKSSSPALAKALRRKHEAQLRKVEKSTARLERRKIKLQAIETKIADLERHLATPDKEHGDARTKGNGTLRPAQLIYNPSAGATQNGGPDRLTEIVNGLRVHGIEVEVGMRTSGREAQALAKKAVRDGRKLVVVAAGDGTVEEVAAQLAGTSTALGIIPVGTMNNLARSLGIPMNIEDACTLVGMETTRHIDMGRLTSDEHPSNDYFLEGAGVGLSAIAMMAGKSFEKRRWHLIPWFLRKIATEKPGSFRLQLDDTALEVSSHIVTISNSPLMARNMLVAPQAKMDDGWFDVVIYDGMSEVELTKHFIDSAEGSAENLRTYRARRIRITADQPMLLNADKNVTRARHVVDLEVMPRALSVIVGNGIALTVGVESAPPAPPLNGEPPDATDGKSPGGEPPPDEHGSADV